MRTLASERRALAYRKCQLKLKFQSVQNTCGSATKRGMQAGCKALPNTPQFIYVFIAL